MVEILKRRGESLEKEKLSALWRRLPQNHPNWGRVDGQLFRCMAGLYGGKSLDYYISHIPHKQLFVFQSLRLPLPDSSHFQIDFLLLFPEGIIIIESKHLKGRILVEEHQLTRELSDITESFSNPVQQVNNQLFHLTSLLRQSAITAPSTATFVAFTHSSSIILPNHNYAAMVQQIIRPDAIREKICSFSQPQLTQKFTQDEMCQIAQLLIKIHNPKNPDVMKKYKIERAELSQGIFCRVCQDFTVVRRRVWVCKRCKTIDSAAPIQALIEYYYLIGEEITNKECREFLQISSSSIVKKFLSKLQLRISGKGKTAKYLLCIKMLKEKANDIEKGNAHK